MAVSLRAPSHSATKLWTFRMLAILLGLAPFGIAEFALRVAGVGLPIEAEDPYVGFDEIHPLFVSGDDGERYVVDPARRAYFRPDSFAAQKGANEFRIFCLGGSTVQGRPYSIETAFSTWLELSLNAADPSRKWEVVNCGGISYASYRLVPILREVLNYEPDLLIVYTGHNEFLEDRTYQAIKSTPAAIATLHGRFSQFRLYNVSRTAWMRIRNQPVVPTSPPQSILPAEVNAMLDSYGGLADYYRDDDWRRGAAEHYGLNLRTMIETAKKSNVPLMLVNPVMNLRDCPPFKSEPSSSLSHAQEAEFDSIWAEAKHSDDVAERIALLKRALEIDGRYAAAHYALAKSYDALGMFDTAKGSYLRAKEEDVCPLRMIEAQYGLLAEIANETGIPLVDVRGFFEAESRSGTPGDDWLLDHVHPSINGHQEIANLIFDEMVRMELVRPRDQWEAEKKACYANHLASLDAAYFVHGTQRLQGLILWTKGRAEGGPKRRRRHGAND